LSLQACFTGVDGSPAIEICEGGTGGGIAGDGAQWDTTPVEWTDVNQPGADSPPVGQDNQAQQLAEEILSKRPNWYLTISNALQWRLQYKRVIQKAGDTKAVIRLRISSSPRDGSSAKGRA